MLAMIAGAAAELRLGDPADPATDVGPVIDRDAKQALEEHLEKMRREQTILFAGRAPKEGLFVAPHIVELDSADALTKEVFGPILHVVRWRADRLDDVIDWIGRTGYGLTFGIHTRVGGRAERIARALKVGNVYVNRNTIGAIVGSQPFGGMGLSGTGPKAGGPNYLQRFAHEQVVSTDTTAAGGNASLVTMEDQRRAPRREARHDPPPPAPMASPRRNRRLDPDRRSMWSRPISCSRALWTHYEHEPGLAGRPMVTVTADGIPGDPLNVGLVGTKEEAIRALAAAGWYPADAVTLKTSIEIAGSVHLRPALSRTRRSARSSTRAASRILPSRSRSGRAPTGATMSASGERSNAARRGGRCSSARPPSTAAPASATTPARSPTTSAPDIDAERDLLIGDLSAARMLTEIYQVTGVGLTLFGRNGGGDPYYTDGEITVGVVTVEAMPSAKPPTILANPPLVATKNAVFDQARQLFGPSEAELRSKANRSHSAAGEFFGWFGSRAAKASRIVWPSFG